MTATMKKYADVVRAYLDGKPIQTRVEGTVDWTDVEEPAWFSGKEYRIKPKEPRIVEKYAIVGTLMDEEYGAIHWISGAYICEVKDEYRYHPYHPDQNYKIVANIKLCCNEETGEILSVELIKENT